MERRIAIESLPVMRALTMLLILTSCEGDGEFPNANFDYYPMQNTKTILREYLFSGGDPYSSDTLELITLGDTTVEGETYRMVFMEYASSYSRIYTAVRKERGQYFEREPECQFYCDRKALKSGPDRMFLNSELKTGDTWTFTPNDHLKLVYMIDDANADVTINGVEYHNVIKVSTNYYDNWVEGEFEFRYTARHYYARGVGEIYGYYPGPLSGTYSDLRVTLLPDK